MIEREDKFDLMELKENEELVAGMKTYNPLLRNLNSLNSMEEAAIHLSSFHSIPSNKEK